MEHDEVNHPGHYTRGKIEVLDFIEDQGLPFHLGQVVKYVCRAGWKPGADEMTDIRKAKFYLDRWLNLLELDQQPVDEMLGVMADPEPINLTGEQLNLPLNESPHETNNIIPSDDQMTVRQRLAAYLLGRNPNQGGATDGPSPGNAQPSATP